MPQMTDIAAKSTSPRRDTPAEAAPFAIDVLAVGPARCVPESRISKVARARAATGAGGCAMTEPSQAAQTVIEPSGPTEPGPIRSVLHQVQEDRGATFRDDDGWFWTMG